MRNYSKRDIESWKFNRLTLPPEWSSHLGNLWENFTMLIQGPSGHGKTEYTLKLSKMLAMHYGKVNFNSTEQGKGPSFQEAWFRNQMGDIPAGKFQLANAKQNTFDPWFTRLERPNSGRIIVLDSIDYMKLTVEQFKKLLERFKGRKCIIMVCWDDPMDVASKKIKYMCDIKVEVKDFQARIRSRAGGNVPFTIYEQPKIAKPNQQQVSMFS